MVMRKNTYTFVVNGAPTVKEFFGKTLTFIPALQANRHIDNVNQKKSKKQAYVLMHVDGLYEDFLNDIVEGTICYAKGYSEEVQKGYVSNISTKLFICEEIGIVEPVVVDEEMEKIRKIAQWYLDEEDSAAEVQEA